MSPSANKTSPAMAQFMAAKEQHPDSLLFFRMGDFYELFFDDAKIASEVLGITLTARNKDKDPVPMAGVPVRSLSTHLKRCVNAGHKVAICEQMQDPKDAKGVVERKVVRVVTPGTLTEDDLLDGSAANFLAAVTSRGDTAGIAWIELSTGDFVVMETELARLNDELTRIGPAELLFPEGNMDVDERIVDLRTTQSRRPAWDFGAEAATTTLTKFFNTRTLEGFGIEDAPQATAAAGALITYLQETQITALPHIRSIRVHEPGEFMVLDRATRSSLELVETMRDGHGTPLLKVLDETRTPMGARLLREWLLAPLSSVDQVVARQAAVHELHGEPARIAAAQEALAGVHDLQRLTTRISCGRANGRDLVALRMGLERVPLLLDTLKDSISPSLQRIAERLDPLTDVVTAIAECLVDDPPTTIKEGGLVRSGFDAELDELHMLQTNSRQWMAEFQANEAEKLGVPNLKVGFNKVFGYYIEITHGNRGAEIPDHYVRKQTTKNAERYITDELKTFETKVLKAEENAQALEYRFFDELRTKVAENTERLMATAATVAEFDVLVGLAHVAIERSYCRPTVDDSRTLRIVDGRHPVIEATHQAGTFVPNDTDLDPPERSLVLLTGPNMAGKSTYIRQNALIVLMAQIGSYVPATEAHVGIVDRVFTRVGAADDISRGASTFMVEMTETANILNNATERSVVILDEVGRGTSTFDGLALAWAIAEDLHNRIGCRGLFATHYHQLTQLEGRGVVNQRVAVKEWGDDIVFLHRIENGATDRSYGLHVGRLAGLPGGVLDRAQSVLESLESDGDRVQTALRGKPTPGPQQLSLFQAPEHPMLEEMKKLDLDGLSPRDAWALLDRWRGEV